MIKILIFFFAVLLSIFCAEEIAEEFCNQRSIYGSMCQTSCVNSICEVLHNDGIELEECEACEGVDGVYYFQKDEESNFTLFSAVGAGVVSFTIIDENAEYTSIRKVARSNETGELCMSPCVDNNFYNASYCLVGRNEAEVFKSECYEETDEEVGIYFASGSNQQEQARCVGECAKGGFGYNWCFIRVDLVLDYLKKPDNLNISGIFDKDNQTVVWDRCSREYGKASSGQNCQTPCKINDKIYYTCTTRFRRNKNYDEPCSPVAVDKPSFMHMVGKISDTSSSEELCKTPCNGFCSIDYSDTFEKCFATDQIQKLYFSSTNELCNGECGGSSYGFCSGSNSESRFDCSLAEGTSTYNNLTCQSECRVRDGETFECLTDVGYEQCSPKPIDKNSSYHLLKALETIKDFSDEDAKTFGTWFKKLKDIFHVKIIDNTDKGFSNATYYVDYVDGIQIVRGVQANVSRDAILKKTFNAWQDSEPNSTYRYMQLQKRYGDNKSLFLHPAFGGSITDELNMVPTSSQLDYMNGNIYLEIEGNSSIKSMNYKLMPLYTFDAHRPYGFVVTVTYELMDHTYSIILKRISEKDYEIIEKSREPEFNDSVIHNIAFRISHIAVIVSGVILICFLIYIYVFKKLEKKKEALKEI